MKTTTGLRNTPKRNKNKISVTLPPALWEGATFLAKESFGNLSAYLAHLIATDLKDHGISVIKQFDTNQETKLHKGEFVVKDPNFDKLRKKKK